MIRCFFTILCLYPLNHLIPLFHCYNSPFLIITSFFIPFYFLILLVLLFFILSLFVFPFTHSYSLPFCVPLLFCYLIRLIYPNLSSSSFIFFIFTLKKKIKFLWKYVGLAILLVYKQTYTTIIMISCSDLHVSEYVIFCLFGLFLS